MCKRNPKVKATLEKIDFINRFLTLSNTTRTIPFSETFRHPDWKEVKRIIEDLGYKSKYDSRESFFKTEAKVIDDVYYYMHIIVKSGVVDVIWVVKNKEEVFLGSPITGISQDFFEWDELIKVPLVSSYEDIKNTLKIIFDMFEDFQKEFSTIV